MLFTTAMKAFPSLQLGPKSLTCDHEYHYKYVKTSEVSIYVMWSASTNEASILVKWPVLTNQRPLFTDLYPELPGDLGLDPLQQCLLGSQPPLVLSLAVNAALSQAPEIIIIITIIIISLSCNLKYFFFFYICLVCWFDGLDLVSNIDGLRALVELSSSMICVKMRNVMCHFVQFLSIQILDKFTQSPYWKSECD